MSEKKSNYTTCPFTGQTQAWTEQEVDNGHWRGDSSADGSMILADSQDALHFRYEKVNKARLELEELESN